MADPTRPDWTFPLVLSLTLGLAPFFPEPHLVEKLRWIAQGGAGMKPIDLFDVVWHGFPWVWLGWTGVKRLRPAPAAPTAPS